MFSIYWNYWNIWNFWDSCQCVGSGTSYENNSIWRLRVGESLGQKLFLFGILGRMYRTKLCHSVVNTKGKFLTLAVEHFNDIFLIIFPAMSNRYQIFINTETLVTSDLSIFTIYFVIGFHFGRAAAFLSLLFSLLPSPLAIVLWAADQARLGNMFVHNIVNGQSP